MEIYGFYFNYDTYESAATLISVHRTLRGAYKAMRKFIIDDYNCWYDDRTLTGKQIFKHSFGQAWYINKMQLCE